MEHDFLPVLYCFEATVGIVIAVAVSGTLGIYSIVVGVVIMVGLTGGTSYARHAYFKKQEQKRQQAERQQQKELAIERQRVVRENAHKLEALFTMASSVTIEDIKSVLTYNTWKEVLDLILALKSKVPGLKIEGEKISIPNIQDLGNALAAYFDDPTLKVLPSDQHPQDDTKQSHWLCETCGRENIGCVNACVGCGALRRVPCDKLP